MTAPGSSSPARVLIADSDRVFRTGLASLLDGPGISVVGTAVDGEDAVEQASTLKPDVVLMDLKMPKIDGVEATRRIHDAQPGTSVLILTEFKGKRYVLPALRAGAKGYIYKDTDPESIAHSIWAVRSGKHVLADAVATRVLEMVDHNGGSKRNYDGLTPRQVDILKLLASGLPNKQIAYQLKLNEKTIRNQVSKMYHRLGLADRSSAILYALREGLVEG
jgi:DNA-binding NarL/FixJ family response regulator